MKTFDDIVDFSVNTFRKKKNESFRVLIFKNVNKIKSNNIYRLKIYR